MANLVKTFSGTSDFEAMTAAETFLQTAGFSVGSNQHGDPRGVMFGEWDIAKWRNLSETEVKALDGRMTSNTGSMRDGPITVTVFETASQEAKRAFHQTAMALAQ